MKTALITGVTGQDGSYLSEFLLDKGYEVHGIKRRASSFNTERIDHIYENPRIHDNRFYLHYGDLSDSSSITRIIKETKPDEIYNLAAQSHVAVSFDAPEYTADVDALGTLRILEAIRFLGMETKCRFYQASTSELYGLAQEVPNGIGIIALNPGIINTEMLQTCWPDNASMFESPLQWSKKAIPFILKLTAKNNGQSLTVQ